MSKPRSKPLRRSPVKRGRKRSRYARRERFPDYLDWLRSQRCRVAVVLGTDRYCEGGPTAAHVGERGLGRKCDDRESISLCYAHGVTDQHQFGRGRDGKRGFFAAMSKTERQAFYDEHVSEQRSSYLAESGRL